METATLVFSLKDPNSRATQVRIPVLALALFYTHGNVG